MSKSHKAKEIFDMREERDPKAIKIGSARFAPFIYKEGIKLNYQDFKFANLSLLEAFSAEKSVNPNGEHPRNQCGTMTIHELNDLANYPEITECLSAPTIHFLAWFTSGERFGNPLYRQQTVLNYLEACKSVSDRNEEAVKTLKIKNLFAESCGGLCAMEGRGLLCFYCEREMETLQASGHDYSCIGHKYREALLKFRPTLSKSYGVCHCNHKPLMISNEIISENDFKAMTHGNQLQWEPTSSNHWKGSYVRYIPKEDVVWCNEPKESSLIKSLLNDLSTSSANKDLVGMIKWTVRNPKTSSAHFGLISDMEGKADFVRPIVTAEKRRKAGIRHDIMVTDPFTGERKVYKVLNEFTKTRFGPEMLNQILERRREVKKEVKNRNETIQKLGMERYLGLEKALKDLPGKKTMKITNNVKLLKEALREGENQAQEFEVGSSSEESDDDTGEYELIDNSVKVTSVTVAET